MQPIVKPLSYSHRNYLFILLVVIFLFSLPVFIFYSTGYRYSITNDSITATGGLYVASDVVESTIYVDEKEVTDNLRIFRKASYLQGIKPGLRRVHVQAPGYDTWVKELVITPQIVTEAEAFNLPLKPQLRPISQYVNQENQAVYFTASASSTPFAQASTSEPLVIATTTATTSSAYDLNQEFVLLSRLFKEKASSTAAISAWEKRQKLPDFNFSNDLSDLPITKLDRATSTVIIDEMMLYKVDDDIFAKTLSDNTKDMPYYFCVVELSDAIKSRMSIMNFTSTKEKVATSSTLNDSKKTIRACRDEIKLDRKNQPVLDFTFFPNNTNLVLMRFADGIYVTEIDDRSWQNTQLLYPGSNLQMLVYGENIFVKRGEFIFEVLTELIDS